jgi:O-antigen/teichoic acid export membrane protein
VEIVFAGPLVRRLFGADYAGSAAVLPVLALSELLIFADIVQNARFVATRLERRNLQLVVTAALTNVVANFLLIPEYGAVGAAAATLLAYGVRIAGGLLPAETRPAARDALRVLLPAGAAGAAALGVTRWLGTGAAGLVAAAVTYAALLAALRGIRPEGAREILQALRRPGA